MPSASGSARQERRTRANRRLDGGRGTRRSWWTFSDFDRITNLERSLDRAVREGIATRSDVDAWLEEQHRRAATDDFRAEMVKILWVATTP
jgi:hypothetical protein